MDFDFRKQILFAFKESLGNVAKHADAQHVHCRIGGGSQRFTFEVRDDGEGFLVEDAVGGNGLRNLRDRAEAVDGTVTVVSRPGEGTRVTFDAPIRTRRNS